MDISIDIILLSSTPGVFLPPISQQRMAMTVLIQSSVPSEYHLRTNILILSASCSNVHVVRGEDDGRERRRRNDTKCDYRDVSIAMSN